MPQWTEAPTHCTSTTYKSSKFNCFFFSFLTYNIRPVQQNLESHPPSVVTDTAERQCGNKCDAPLLFTWPPQLYEQTHDHAHPSTYVRWYVWLKYPHVGSTTCTVSHDGREGGEPWALSCCDVGSRQSCLTYSACNRTPVSRAGPRDTSDSCWGTLNVHTCSSSPFSIPG